jgi:hypothetical protein
MIPEVPIHWTPEVMELFMEFIDMRRTIRKPIRTERAIKARITKLNDICGLDVEKTKKVIEQSLDNEWQDFYELKENQNSSRWDRI